MPKAIKIVKPVRKTRVPLSVAHKFRLMTLIESDYGSYGGDPAFARYVSGILGVNVGPATVRHFREGLGVPQIKMGQKALLDRIAELEAQVAALKGEED
jgi:hypothetical protein